MRGPGAWGPECRSGSVRADPTERPYGARFLADTRVTVCLVAASGLESVSPDAGSAPVCSSAGSSADASIVVPRDASAATDASAPLDGASDAERDAALDAATALDASAD